LIFKIICKTDHCLTLFSAKGGGGR
jgi:hypothetical protein